MDIALQHPGLQTTQMATNSMPKPGLSKTLISQDDCGNDEIKNQAIGERKAYAESERGSHFCINKMIAYHFRL